MDDKKKLMIVIALAVVVVAVGAFQMMPKGGGEVAAADVYATDTSGSGETATAAGEKPKSKEELEREKSAEMIAVLGGPLSQRDPFVGGAKSSGPALAVTPPAPVVQAPANTPSPRIANNRRPSGGGSRPASMPGYLPMDPNRLGAVPQGGGDASPSGPGYSVTGVVVGERPMAVFKDSEGNQRLVPLGGQVDPDTKVIGIERGRVKVKTSDGEKTLTLEGK